MVQSELAHESGKLDKAMLPATDSIARPNHAGTHALRLALQEDLNFLLTNRLPRRLATKVMGRLSRIEQPHFCRAAIAVWRLFAPDLDLTEAETTRFKSIHECFTRRLKAGARSIDMTPNLVVSPVDAIVGEFGTVEEGLVLQAKGMPYTLAELLQSPELAAQHRGSKYLTMRLKSSFYHRFHAPCAASLREVTYISGDTWNVNPIALKRVERLFCRNERAVLNLHLGHADQVLTLVPVAAILVASIQLHCLPGPLDLRSRGANRIACASDMQRGEELGWFQHGSTVILFAAGGFEFLPHIRTGELIRVGQPILGGLKTAHDSPDKQTINEF
jgi:phosphatidylserine decarboxylase